MNVETRPWGRYTILYQDKQTWLKRLIISPGQSLSLQSHKDRMEFWTTQDDGILAIIRSEQLEPFYLLPGEVYIVQYNDKHRLHNTCNHEVSVLEWATGSPTESDIIRYADDYGRSDQ